MGRRSINTTKSGKYMNPTDQARKEARKQELKKNKKQRQMVRAAVLKGKDPQQLLEEMEKIDQMEFNVNQPSPLNEKVLKDKRKKLRDTLERVLSMYYKDDPDKWSDLKRQQTEYEMKRNQLVAFYESVKSAQQVTVDEIPLPQLPQMRPPTPAPAAQIPLPQNERKTEHTIYSIATALKLQALGQPVRKPPGCPPGPPPDLDDEGDVIEFFARTAEDEKTVDKEDEASVKPTSLQQKMVALSGQNVDDFIKEMETVQKKGESGKDEDETDEKQRAKATTHAEPLVPPGTTEPVPNLPSQPPTSTNPLHLFPTAIRLPPGPPPGRPMMPPGGPPPGMPPPPRLPMRMPQMGPRMIRIPNVQIIQPNVLSAAPQLINRSDAGKQSATISAKPQIRNLTADVTRFVPSTLRVKREDKKGGKSTSVLVRELKRKEYSSFHPGGGTKDDAYKQFMQEMENLL